MNDGLRRALGSLARARRSGVDAAPAPPPEPEAPWGTPFRGTPASVESFLPGGEWRNARGAVYVHERLRSQMEKPAASWPRLGAPPECEEQLAALAAAGLGRALFLDLETGGLGSSMVFLAGMMHWNGEDFVLRQAFARHYGEEATLIGLIHEVARGFDYLVTFNGRSYDGPMLAMRALIHGVPLELPPAHVDLLHPSRRRWKHRLPDCRLQTLEWHVCRRRRVGDVPGDEVPGLYHDWVRSGDPWRLVPVFHHNLLDVITMGEILSALCDARRHPLPECAEVVDADPVWDEGTMFHP